MDILTNPVFTIAFFDKMKMLIQFDSAQNNVIKNFLIYNYYIFLSVLFIALAASFALSFGSILAEARKISGRSWFWALMVFNAALLLRFFYIAHHPQIFYDEVTFIETAENYCKYGINAQNYIGPVRNEFLICSTGWPFLISLIFKITGINIQGAFYLSAILSSLTTILVFFAVSMWLGDEKAGLWSSLIYAVYPVYLRIAGSSAMETPSVFFIFLTILAFGIYFRQQKTRLLYFSFFCLAYTLNIRQEAFMTLLPLFLLFFLLFNPNLKKELGRIHIYICLLFTAIFLIPPSTASIYGISTGFYYFYETTEMIQSHILHNIQYNLTYWLSNRIQPLSVLLLALFGFSAAWKFNKKFCGYFAFWFISLYVFYTINPSCDFSSLITLDSWRSVSHLIIPLVIFSGYGVSAIIQILGVNYPKLKPAAILLLLISVFIIPLQFRDFIQHKTIYAQENLFIHHMSRQVPKESRIIVDGGIQSNMWESFMSQFSYTSQAAGKHYDIDPATPMTSRRMFRDLYKWKNLEHRPVFLYLTNVNLADISTKYVWYFEHLEMKLAGGFGIRRNKKSFMIYEITGVKDIPYVEGSLQ
ncbi:MAG: glycosyltransferase family 39 protein [Firmicutes bacterium]|nr:glycosyltransferase family 39 protein [Bacillota bacterium]